MATMCFTGHNGGNIDSDGVLNAGSWPVRFLRTLRACRWICPCDASDGETVLPVPVSAMGPCDRSEYRRWVSCRSQCRRWTSVGHDVGNMHCCSVRNQVRFEIARTTVASQSRLPLDHIGVINVGILIDKSASQDKPCLSYDVMEGVKIDHFAWN
ncbi:PREDICTED: uncharacterized protein LOC105144432 [Acromyrmex echinatior]|uniref:uncharacterized protein LOC105144432 n=1 Tax=Acromyrmex echinatior TaxID=103372 RepID=UPI000580D103|nr:PREDICTED: uncharacterized protein LOC105144432 [Acromyrmex echinatior]